MKKRRIILCLKSSPLVLQNCFLFNIGKYGLHTNLGFFDYSDIERWSYL